MDRPWEYRSALWSRWDQSRNEAVRAFASALPYGGAVRYDKAYDHTNDDEQRVVDAVKEREPLENAGPAWQNSTYARLSDVSCDTPTTTEKQTHPHQRSCMSEPEEGARLTDGEERV